MQSKNQVIVLAQVFIKNQKRPLSQTVWLTKLKKRDHYPTLLLPPGFKLYSLLVQCSGCVQSKNRVDLVEVRIFYKSEKMSCQTVWPIKVKKRSTFVPYHGFQTFFIAFTMVWANSE